LEKQMAALKKRVRTYYGGMNQDEQSPEVPHEISREEALEKIRKLRRPLPPGFKFNRDEAHERSGFGDLRKGLIVEGVRIEDPLLPTDKP
jgi:hypothetical protein